MKYIIIVLLIFAQDSRGQKLSIETEFTQNGIITSKAGLDGDDLANFDKGNKCIVIDYSGYNYYKVKTEKATGFVRSDYLDVTYEMKTFAKKFEENRKEERAKEKERAEKEIKDKEQKEKEILLLEIKKIHEDSKERQELNKKKDSLRKLNSRKECQYIRNEIDKYDKIKVVETEYYGVKSNFESEYYLSIKLMKYGGKKYIYFSLDEDLGCVSGYSTSKSSVKVLLENDGIITFYHNGDVDCAEFTLRGTLSEKEIMRLQKSKIKSIKLEGTEYYKDLDDIDYKEFFIDKLKCLKQ